MSSRDAAVVLLSAGLDSAFNLFKAVQQFDVKMALTFNYGQRAAVREVTQAQKLATRVSVPHLVVELPWFKEFTRTSLLGQSEIPRGENVQIDNLEQSQSTAKAVWVPNRNGIFLNIAAGFAEGLGARYVIPGFNLEEAQTFPDNSLAFLKTLDESWRFSTQAMVQTFCYSANLTKTQIVNEAKKLRLPFEDLWPCYLAEEKWCGECESCQRFRRALEANELQIF